MILKQQFKTYEGARKRAAFENAHTKKYQYSVVWQQMFNGRIWRLERTTRKDI